MSPTTKEKTMDSTTKQHHDAIRANVDDMYAKRIDFKTFDERASVLHAAVRADGPDVDDALLGLLRAALRGPSVAGQECTTCGGIDHRISGDLCPECE